MLISTKKGVPGITAAAVLGEVRGHSARSRNLFSQLGAWCEPLGGGALEGGSWSEIGGGTAVVIEPNG